MHEKLFSIQIQIPPRVCTLVLFILNCKSSVNVIMSTENTDDHELFSQYSDSSDMDTADEQLLTPNCCTRRVPGPYRRAFFVN